MLDVFKKDAFQTVSLTTAINKMPYKPGRLGQLGLFIPKPITTLTALVEEKQGKLMLIPTAARGTMPNAFSGPGRKIRPFRVPHIPLNSSIAADDVQGVREFGSENTVESITKLVNDRLEEMRASFEVTHEWHRVGAIRGAVLDADGTSEIANFFTEFGITEDEVYYDFDTATTDVKQVTAGVIRMIKTALGGTTYSGIRAFCGDDFFDALTSHATVKTAYERWQSGEYLRTQQLENGFPFAGVFWENYTGGIGDQTFIPSDTCRFVPDGVPDLFQMIYAPANFVEAVNTPGKPIYAKQERMQLDMGILLHAQSNPLAMCTRPKVLVKGTYGTAGSTSASTSGSA